MSHTKGKLNYLKDEEGAFVVYGEDKKTAVALIWPANEEDKAERIVQCWNSHDALVEALENILDRSGALLPLESVTKAYGALKSAKGE